jgi:hypothetical protein
MGHAQLPLQHGLYSTGDYGEPDEPRIFVENFDAVLKTWAIFIPVLVVLLWAAWKMRGIFKT